jgi:ribosomal protein S18 acetylase RimI-like enzyme
MELRLDEALQSPAWPAGVSVRTSELPRDAAAVHTLLELAYQGAADIPPFDEWLTWWTEDDEFDPGAWFLVEAGCGLAGAALCWNTGFVKDLAVHPKHRRRGIGHALLLHVFSEFQRRGTPAVALKVDANNPTGAVRLYERLGMRVAERLEIRP